MSETGFVEIIDEIEAKINFKSFNVMNAQFLG